MKDNSFMSFILILIVEQGYLIHFTRYRYEIFYTCPLGSTGGTCVSGFVFNLNCSCYVQTDDFVAIFISLSLYLKDVKYVLMDLGTH